MQQAATDLEFEKAAHYRDQIATLRQYQNVQNFITDTGESDIIACAIEADQACLQIFYIRGGRNLGNKSYFPRIKMGEGEADLIETFIKQYYLSGSDEPVPANIYVSHKPDDCKLLENVLSKKLKKAVHIKDNCRGEKGKWVPGYQIKTYRIVRKDGEEKIEFLAEDTYNNIPMIIKEN